MIEESFKIRLQIIFCKNCGLKKNRILELDLDGGITVGVVHWNADLEERWLTVVQEDDCERLEASLWLLLDLLWLLLDDHLLLWLLLDGLDGSLLLLLILLLGQLSDQLSEQVQVDAIG